MAEWRQCSQDRSDACYCRSGTDGQKRLLATVRSRAVQNAPSLCLTSARLDSPLLEHSDVEGAERRRVRARRAPNHVRRITNRCQPSSIAGRVHGRAEASHHCQCRVGLAQGEWPPGCPCGGRRVLGGDFKGKVGVGVRRHAQSHTKGAGWNGAAGL